MKKKKKKKKTWVSCLAGLPHISHVNASMPRSSNTLVEEIVIKIKTIVKRKVSQLNHEILPCKVHCYYKANTSTETTKFCQIVSTISDSFSF